MLFIEFEVALGKLHSSQFYIFQSVSSSQRPMLSEHVSYVFRSFLNEFIFNEFLSYL